MSGKIVPHETSQEGSVRQKIRKKSKDYQTFMKMKEQNRNSKDKELNTMTPFSLEREKRDVLVDEDPYSPTPSTESPSLSKVKKSVCTPVSPEIEKILLDAIDQHYIFAEFTMSERKKFISMMRCELFDPNEIVSRQGEFGTKFHIIVKGSATVEQDGVNVEILRERDSFGSVSLIRRCQCVSTVRTREKTELWTIPGVHFRRIVKANQTSKVLKIKDYLKSNQIFKKMSDTQLEAASEAFVLQTFQDQTCIVREGEHDISVFYVLISGRVRVTCKGKLKTTFKPGRVFAYRCLVENAPRYCTCVAEGKVECYAAILSDFEKFVDCPFENVMNMNNSGSSALDAREESPKKSGTTSSSSRSSSSTSANQNVSAKSLRSLRRSWSGCELQERPKVPKKSSRPHHFQSIGILGRGGFGIVILTKHKASGNPLVLKICTATTKKAYKVASRERDLLKRLNHRHIVSLLNSYERNGTKEITLVLEYLIGGDLFNLLISHKTFDAEATRYYTASVYLAISHMHRMSIICRDLKLENMAISSNGTLKLIDLGLAKRTLKKCYTVCGSPEIISPEMIKNTGYHFQIDFWALGVLVHEMAVGSAPFGDRNSYASVHRSVVQYARQRRFVKRNMSEFEAIQMLLPALARSKQGYTTASFVYRLLNPHASLRLGCTKQRKRNFEGHMFFQSKSWNWKKFRKGDIPAPFVPVVNSPFDMSNFEKSQSSEDDFSMVTHAMRDEEKCCVVM